MAARYVPPHLRQHMVELGANTEESTLPQRPLSAMDSIQHYTIHELNTHYGGRPTTSPIRVTQDRPEELAYIVLLRDTQSKWDTDRDVFAQENIETLPGYEVFSIQSAPHFSEEQYHTMIRYGHLIPVFMEIDRHESPRKLMFKGYYHLKEILFHPPHTLQLKHMLQRKWNIDPTHPGGPPSKLPHRHRQAWLEEYGKQWATLRFSAIPHDPQHEVLPGEYPKVRAFLAAQETVIWLGVQYSNFMDDEGNVILNPEVDPGVVCWLE